MMSSLVLDGLLGLHAVSTLMLTGLIWMVQIVHYPLFAHVGEGAFCAYGRQHARRITWLVGPLMALEAVAALALPFLLDTAVARTLTGVGVLLLLVVWGSTAFLQVPCHARLSRGFDGLAWRRLVGTNWIRTGAWSLRGVLSILLFRFVT
jgi:hypothetical protein